MAERDAKMRSINGKLRRLVFLAVGTAMLVVAGFGCWQEANRYLAAKRDTLLAAATAFAAACSDAAAAHDSRGASLAIRGIAALSDIDFASVSDVAGHNLAAVGSGVRLAGDLDLTAGEAKSSPLDLLATHTVSVTVPIRKGGITVGRLKIVGRVVELWSRLGEVLWTTMLAALAALVVGLAISMRLQRSIVRPLIALAGAMTSIQKNHDYSPRIVIDADDEIGLLADSFNGMLDEVRERDHRLLAHRDRLEQDVAARTQDLTVAKEDAEAANAAKTTFLATMSHEIRTPMTGLLVMAELLASGDLSSRSRRYAEIICSSGTALLAIINDILDFSKIEAGKLETERVRVDIRDIVGTVINLFYPRAIEKNLDLAAVFASGVPAAVEGDPVRLQQIISNLVNNALKFTKDGHVIVRVSYEAGVLACSVIDTGIGITAEKIEHIFKAFAQADGSTTREFGGTGLGLSISSRLAEAMGGTIAVESVAGSGSAFTCSVPAPLLEEPPVWKTCELQQAFISIRSPATAQTLTETLHSAGYVVRLDIAASDSRSTDLFFTDQTDNKLIAADQLSPHIVRLQAPGTTSNQNDSEFNLSLPLLEIELRDLLTQIALGTAKASSQSRSRPSEAETFGAARVLVADDMAVNREVMIEALSRFGIVPDLVVNGVEAVEAALTKNYDLVFMDGSMPELDGFDACRLLRQKQTAGHYTPVVALTAHVVGLSANAWREAGMDGILHKPFTMAEMLRTLESYLRPSGSVIREEAPAAPAIDPGLSDAPLLDAAVLAEITSVSSGAGVQHGFAQRVFRLFIEHVPQCLSLLSSASQAGDHSSLAAAAHSVKSMSLNIGAKKAAQLAAVVEKSARENTIEPVDVSSLIEALEQTVQQLSIELDLMTKAESLDPSSPIKDLQMAEAR